MSFVWNIPSIPHSTQKLLCYGYIRQTYRGYISADILQIFCDFYSPNDQYYTLNDIKNSQQFRKYVSPIFSVDQFKCYLEFWPNGSNENNKGQARLFFCFLFIQPKIENICCAFTLGISETNTKFIKRRKNFNKASTYCPWSANILPFEKLKDQNIDKLTIYCFITKLEFTQKHLLRNPTTTNVTNLSANIITHFPTQTYTWEISSTKMVNIIRNPPNVYGIASPIFELFGLKWYLTFCPNGSRITRKGKANCYVHLASVPYTDMSVWVKQRLSFCGNVDESILKHTASSDGWGMDSSVKTAELKNMNSFIFGLEITLIDIARKNKLMTDEFSAKSNIENRENILIENSENNVCSFKWAIHIERLDNCGTDASLASGVFVMFKLKWCLFMDATGKVSLRLEQRKWKAIEVISVRCFIGISELNMRYTLNGVYDKGNDIVSWGDERIDIAEFRKFGQCQLTLEMELIDIYCKGENIRHKFLK